MGAERREYKRIPVNINGTIYKDGYEIPVSIANMSENGIGLSYNNKNCPEDFDVHKSQIFSIIFIDERISGKDLVANNVQQCIFEIAHTEKDQWSTYIGARLVYSQMDYAKYVKTKEEKTFTAGIRFMDFARRR